MPVQRLSAGAAMTRLDNHPLPMADAVLKGYVLHTFGRYICNAHQVAMQESSQGLLAFRPAHAQTAWKCPAEGCRLEAWT